jgi:hypothetical protein
VDICCAGAEAWFERTVGRVSQVVNEIRKGDSLSTPRRSRPRTLLSLSLSSARFCSMSSVPIRRMVAVALAIAALFLRYPRVSIGAGMIGKEAHESAQDGKPNLEDGDDTELAGGGEDGAKSISELVCGRVGGRGVGEGVEGVAKAGEADDVEGGAAEPDEGVDSGGGV